MGEEGEEEQESEKPMEEKDYEFNDEIPDASAGKIFVDFHFYIHESVPKDKAKECRKVIESHSGNITTELNKKVTHVVVDKV